MKIFKYNTKEGLFVRNIIEIQSKQEIILTDTTLKEQFRSNTKQDFITIEKPIIEIHTLLFEYDVIMKFTMIMLSNVK